LSKFNASRENITTEPVGAGLDRALHATYLSYLKPSMFTYGLGSFLISQRTLALPEVDIITTLRPRSFWW